MITIENQVLPGDIEEAKELQSWATYCCAIIKSQIKCCDFENNNHWNGEMNRAINDLKHLKFKKTDIERKIEDEKRNEGA